MNRDPRVDDYIGRQAGFAIPILEELRERIHASLGDGEETLKWGAPSFLYKGAILGGMAAFKAHAVFGFWQGEAVTGEPGRGAMGSFGRLTSVADLPARAEFAVPEDLRQAFEADPAAAASFESFSLSSRHEYLEWIIQAKRPETRARRIAQAVEWLAKGRKRNWKYERG